MVLHGHGGGVVALALLQVGDGQVKGELDIGDGDEDIRLCRAYAGVGGGVGNGHADMRGLGDVVEVEVGGAAADGVPERGPGATAVHADFPGVAVAVAPAAFGIGGHGGVTVIVDLHVWNHQFGG